MRGEVETAQERLESKVMEFRMVNTEFEEAKERAKALGQRVLRLSKEITQLRYIATREAYDGQMVLFEERES